MSNALVHTYQVQAGDFNAAGDASAEIKQIAKQLGIGSALVRRLSIASYEAELNLIIHSLGGTLKLLIDGCSIKLISDDVGPGIPDVDQAMQEGYSTAPESARALGFGAGMGLPNMKRNTDHFEIVSHMGEGTVITMEFQLQ